MPIAAPRPCSCVGCRALSVSGGRCKDHQREPWQKKPEARKRVSGRKLQAWRKALFESNPLCAECWRDGRVTPATERDHIIPWSDGGTDDLDNIQALCADCHEAKSQIESQKAKRR